MRVSKLLIQLPILFSTIAINGVAHADDLRCNKQQTICLIDNRDVIVGDNVGIFTEDQELVAKGVVKGMKGTRRMVSIEESSATIRKGYKLALLENTNTSGDGETGPAISYKIYRDPAKYLIGAGAAIATFGIGRGSPGGDYDVFGAMRGWRDIEIGGRLNYLGSSGEVTRNSTTHEGIETDTFNLRGFGVLGTVGYTWLKNKSFSIRGESGVGFMYVSADVGGDAGLVEGAGYTLNASNGAGKYVRASVAGLYNMDSWHIQAAAFNSWLHNTMATGLSLGLIHEIRAQ